jgi:uncharacterized membrane protein YoaK (UPF0700 family)
VESRDNKSQALYLTCEKYYIFELLIFAGGMMGAYTYNLRGGVFCNAQTANVVLMALAFGHGQWQKGFYYLIPITAYFAGAAVSEALPSGIRHRNFLRWDTCLIAFEILILFLLGFVPLTWPAQIVQVTNNFLCSMQYNTFRQAEGIGMATTFCTNHLRQFGSFLIRALRTGDKYKGRKCILHGIMILLFVSGAFVGTLGCSIAGYHSIWGAGIVLLFIFARLLYADRTYEKDMLELTPRGH